MQSLRRPTPYTARPLGPALYKYTVPNFGRFAFMSDYSDPVPCLTASCYMMEITFTHSVYAITKDEILSLFCPPVEVINNSHNARFARFCVLDLFDKHYF